VSALSELEVREWLEEQGAGAEERRGRSITVPPHSGLHGHVRSLSLLPCNFLGVHLLILGQAWAEGKALRGQQTGN